MKELMFKKNVFAVGEGYKITNNINTKEPCIVCFVSFKTDKLKDEDRIPKNIKGLKIDVIQIIQPEIVVVRKQKHRPLIVGISGAGEQITGCTIGIPVYYKGKQHLLSNQHCAIPVSGKFIDLSIHKRKAYLQPSTIDSGKYKTDVIGKVVKLGQIIADKSNICDSALIEINDDIKVSQEIYKIGGYKNKIVKPFLEQKLQKSGRTTGHTKMKVIALNTSINILFRIGNKKQNILFTNQVITNNSNGKSIKGGDSSSIALDMNGNLVGQIFAASSTIGVITPLQNVQKALKFTFKKIGRQKETLIFKIFNMLLKNKKTEIISGLILLLATIFVLGGIPQELFLAILGALLGVEIAYLKREK